MARQIFYSFHFGNDFWRVHQIRSIGKLEDNAPVSANDWEEIKRKGDDSIRKWINDNMNYRSCIVVLIGKDTANRPWVKYEIEKAYKDGKGLVGIYIHGLKGQDGLQSSKGANPFDVNIGGVKLSSIAKVYDSPYSTSTYVYNDIKDQLPKLVEAAILLR
jgi:hypothetical protein